MDKKKEIRITIDGMCNTGKTLLAWAFADWLKQNGVEDAQISFFNDGMPAPDILPSVLENAIANGVFKNTEFAFVERSVPRSYLAPGERDSAPEWSAKPEKYSPVFFGKAHIDMEMGRFQPMRLSWPGSLEKLRYDDEAAEHAPSVQNEPLETSVDFTGRATMKHVRDWIAAQNPKHGVRLNTIMVMVEQYNDFLGNLDAGGHTLEPAMLSAVRERMWKTALNTDQAFVPDRSLLSRYVDVNIANRREAKERLVAQIRAEAPADTPDQAEARVQVGRTLVAAGLSSILDDYAVSWVRPLTDDPKHTLEVGFVRHNTYALTFSEGQRLEQEVQAKCPHFRVSYKVANSSISGAHSTLTQAGRDALQAMTSEQIRASSPVLVGRPFGENLGDHNGELESGFKYRMQIHPQTGETREQMLLRAHPFIRMAHIGGHPALDYSNLPTDLTFDHQCGVRWKTPAEMAEVQKEVDAVFEKAQGDTFAKHPRGMTSAIYTLEDPPFIERPNHKFDAVLEETRARIVNPEPKPAYFSGITDDSRQAGSLDVAQHEGHMGVNLMKVKDIGSNDK